LRGLIERIHAPTATADPPGHSDRGLLDPHLQPPVASGLAQLGDPTAEHAPLRRKLVELYAAIDTACGQLKLAA